MSEWTTHLDIFGRPMSERQVCGRTLRVWRHELTTWPYCHRAYGQFWFGVWTWRAMLGRKRRH